MSSCNFHNKWKIVLGSCHKILGQICPKSPWAWDCDTKPVNATCCRLVNNSETGAEDVRRARFSVVYVLWQAVNHTRIDRRAPGLRGVNFRHQRHCSPASHCAVCLPRHSTSKNHLQGNPYPPTLAASTPTCQVIAYTVGLKAEAIFWWLTSLMQQGHLQWRHSVFCIGVLYFRCSLELLPYVVSFLR